jgi:hypothetical protein
MDSPSLHEKLPEIAPRVLCAGGDAELAEAEADAAAGCSICARALVNARDVAVTLSEEVAAEQKPSPSAALRGRILGSVKGALPPRREGKPRRFFDPAGEIARLHIGAPGDAERVREIDELGMGEPREGDACGRFLAQIERLIGFPLLFVSVVRGERVGYRAQRGLDASQGDMRDRRRETTFCTHTVCGALPLVIPNAATEPFFRGSNMVSRVGVKAYVGVPLRTSTGIIPGTVCAMDFKPRAIGADVVRVLELYAEPILAEIERARRMPADRVARTAAGTPVHGAGWFSRLLEIEHRFAGSRPSALIAASGMDAEVLADAAREGEIPARLAGSTTALLLPGADPRGAENRLAEIRDALASSGAVASLGRASAADHVSARDWLGAALAAAG